jgi:uncharacterized repeat protein (TIGR01451 family)
MSRAKLLCLAVSLALLALGGSANSASAEPVWEVSLEHGPTSFSPGATGQYQIYVRNLGDSPQAGTLTVTTTLPPGTLATNVESLTAGFEEPWACGGVGTATVTCSREDTSPISPANGIGPLNGNGTLGFGPAIQITVTAPTAQGVYTSEAVVSGGGGADASASDPTTVGGPAQGFGFASGSLLADVFDGPGPGAASVRHAGGHPFELRVAFRDNLQLKDDLAGIYTTTVEDSRRLVTKMPEGFVGNPLAAPKCGGGELEALRCPTASQVGTIDLLLNNGNVPIDPDSTFGNPVYNMDPPKGDVAAFGFRVVGVVITIGVTLDPHDHSVVSTIDGVPQTFQLRRAALTLWGVPADPAHDLLRVDSAQNFPDGGFGAASPDVGNPKPFLTLPSKCGDAVGGRVTQDSWQHPGDFHTDNTPPWEISGCDDPRMRFQPTITVQPTSHESAAPTGLDVDLFVAQKRDGDATSASQLYAQNGKDMAIMTPTVKDSVTNLPVGMAVNPSAADGLLGCSQADVGLDSNDDPTCPDASKIGTVEIESDLVPDPLKGSVYQAKQFENPHGSLLGFYTVAQGNGLTIKLAAKVAADPDTGQLRTIFLNNPQLPFTHYKLHFFGGSRAVLVNPPTCGAHIATATISSWNDQLPEVAMSDSFQLTSGPNGGPCVGTLAARPFSPRFAAGSSNPLAGAFSPFALEASRDDGTQELRTIETTLPPGMLGRLAGISYCPESVVSSISTAPGTGLGERLHPSCPATSLIGHTDAAAGAGTLPFHNPGNVYLSGPRNGSPLSLAIVTPVVAGPLDLGSILVRADLRVDPVTAQVHVTSDAIPEKIVAAGNGFPLNLRSVRVMMDRDRFTLNPTSCDPMAVDGQIGSLQGTTASVSERFQVGACAALGFKPKLGLRLLGSTKRGGHPKLRAVVQMPEGNANIGRAVVSLPHSEFLDQAHIGTVCTRVQYAADACPAASVYGYARAFTLLLDQPLQGPVYLRSSSHKLPDLVASLDGQIHVDLAGRIDSVRGGIRSTFETVPDAPVSKLVLTMKGGKKGLLQNSRDLCAHSYRAEAAFDAHNGRIADSRPMLHASCAKGERR